MTSINTELYNIELFELLKLINEKFYKNADNLFQLAGFVYTYKSLGDINNRYKTYILICREKLTNFNKNECKTIFDDWYNNKNEVSVKFKCTLTLKLLKQLAGGNNHVLYNNWKNKYNLKISKEIVTINNDDDDDDEYILNSEKIQYNNFDESDYYFSDFIEYYDENIFEYGSNDHLKHFIKNFHKVAAIYNNDIIVKKNGSEYFHITKLIGFSNCVIQYKDEDNKIKKIDLHKFIQYNIKYVKRFNTILCNYDFDNRDRNVFICSRKYIANKIDNFQNEKLDILLNFMYEIIFSKDDIMFNYELDKLAIMCKFPHLKSGIITILISPQGAGKNTYSDFLCRFLIGPYNSVSNLPGLDCLLNTDKNQDTNGMKLVCINESSSQKDTYLSNFDKLKSLVTEENQRIRKLYADAIYTKQSTDYIILSNHKNSYILENVKSRREFIPDIDPCKIDDIQYFIDLRSKIFNQECGDSFYTFLLNRDITYEKFRKIPIPLSKLKIEIAQNCKSPEQLFIEDFIEELDDNKDSSRIIPSSKLYLEYRSYCDKNGINIKSNIYLSKKLNALNYFSKKSKNGNIYIF